MLLQLNPAIPVITPKGRALAHFLIDNGVEHDLEWVCFQNSSGEFWSWKNPQIRAQKNITEQRDYISPFYDPKDTELTKNNRIDDEDVDDDDEEIDDQEDDGKNEKKTDWEACYDEKVEELCELYHKIEKIRQKYEMQLKKTRKSIEILQSLVNNNHVVSLARNRIKSFLATVEAE
jgi:hypothetical protein